jgi:hypothetical protein
MGYFVRTLQSDFRIKEENFEKAYDALVALNDNDEIKSGGSYGGDGISADSPRPAGKTHHPARWFSWMDANYPEKYEDLPSILEALGFELLIEKGVGIRAIFYDSKIGDEVHFLRALAPFVEDNSYLLWSGEDGATWGQVFVGGKMREKFIGREEVQKMLLEELTK